MNFWAICQKHISSRQKRECFLLSVKVNENDAAKVKNLIHSRIVSSKSGLKFVDDVINFNPSIDALQDETSKYFI